MIRKLIITVLAAWVIVAAVYMIGQAVHSAGMLIIHANRR